MLFAVHHYNLGYLGAAYQALLRLAKGSGLKEASERTIGENFGYVILSNTDLQIGNSNFYQMLMTRENLNRDVGLLAPSISSELTGRESNPLYLLRPSAKKMNFLVKVYSWYPLAVIYHVLGFFKSRLQSLLPEKTVSQIYAAHGAFLIFTGSFLRPVELLIIQRDCTARKFFWRNRYVDLD